MQRQHRGDFPGQTEAVPHGAIECYCYSSCRSLRAEATRSFLPSLWRLQEISMKQLFLQQSVLPSPPLTPSPVPLPSPPQTPLPRSHLPHSPSPPPPAVITDGPGCYSHHTAAQEDSDLEKPPRRRLQTSHKLLRRFFFPVVETTATIVVALPTVAFLRKALIWLQLFQMLGIAQET